MQVVKYESFPFNCVESFGLYMPNIVVFFILASVIFKYMLGWRLCYSLSPEMFISVFTGSKSNSAICMYLVSSGEGKNIFSRLKLFSMSQKIYGSNYEKIA